MSEVSNMEKLKGIFHKSGKPDYEEVEVPPGIFFVEFSKLPQKDKEKRLRSMIGKDVLFFFDSLWVDGLLFKDDRFFMDGKEYVNVTFSSNPLTNAQRYYERDEKHTRDTFDVLFT